MTCNWQALNWLQLLESGRSDSATIGTSRCTEAVLQDNLQEEFSIPPKGMPQRGSKVTKVDIPQAKDHQQLIWGTRPI